MSGGKSLSDLSRYRQLADQALQEYQHAVRTAKEERVRLKELKAKAKASVEAQSIIQTVAQAVQQSAHQQIVKVVTRCIQAVGWDYEFRINFERKRGRTEARMVFVRGGVEIDPVSSSGGGVIDVASFALRLACLLLATPRRRRLVVLDEPLRQVHGNTYRENVVELLRVLAKELDFQLIIATGLEWLSGVGKTIEIGEPS